VQKELRISERTFRRLFDLHVGISPKMFSRICQFDSAFQQLNTDQFSKLSDVAYENGYADQSHLIRSFKEFTTFSPSEYLKKRNAFQRLNF
jgi:AraC-like DNA-binding protein